MAYKIEDVEKSFMRAFPFPPVLYKVASMIKEGSDSLYKLGQEIAKDPVLSAKLLSVTNSPYYGTKQKISDLPHAVSMLGFNEVSTVVVRIITEKSLFDTKRTPTSFLYLPRKIWLHSLKVAHINRILVREANPPLLLEAYLAGLMHDIGKNAIGLCIEPRDEKIIMAGVKNNHPLYEMEEQVLGFSHAQCGFRILKQMNLSLEVLKMVRRHHAKMKVDFKEADFLLALANVLANFEHEDDLQERDKKLHAQFGITSNGIKDLDKIYGELHIDMEFL
jgi:putative nucleotidyltransferase with HDIG domain